MIKLKEHIIFKISTVLLIFTLLAPSAVKFSHIFQKHKHEICLSPNNLHIHQSDLDCDFFKFKLNTQFIFSNEDFEHANVLMNTKPLASQYQFYYTTFSFQFQRRGPPSLI